MAIDPKVQADLVAAQKAMLDATAAFGVLRKKWVESIEAGDVVCTGLGKATIVERLPSDASNPRFKLSNPAHGDFSRESLVLGPWTPENEAAAKVEAQRRAVCDSVSTADEKTLAAIDALLKNKPPQ